MSWCRCKDGTDRQEDWETSVSASDLVGVSTNGNAACSFPFCRWGGEVGKWEIRLLEQEAGVLLLVFSISFI